MLFIILIIILFLFSFTYYDSKKNIKQVITINNKKADITKPKFAISSDKQRISITAKEGFFLTNDKVMLEKNVIFKSSRFKILSDNVIFNKKNLVASSDHKSKFFS